MHVNVACSCESNGEMAHQTHCHQQHGQLHQFPPVPRFRRTDAISTKARALAASGARSRTWTIGLGSRSKSIDEKELVLQQLEQQ